MRMDQNALLRKLAAQAGVDAALKRLSDSLCTADGKRTVSNSCPRSTPTNSNRPQGPHSMAQSAQRLMQAPEGSLLAAAFNGRRLRYHVLGLPVYRYSASWIGKKRARQQHQHLFIYLYLGMVSAACCTAWLRSTCYIQCFPSPYLLISPFSS